MNNYAFRKGDIMEYRENDYKKNGLENYIEKLKDLLKSKDNRFLEILNSAENLIAEGIDADLATFVYELAGDYYHSMNMFDKSVLYYLMAFEAIDRFNFTDDSVKIINKICRGYSRLNQFQDALYYLNFALEFEDMLHQDSIIKLIFNKALCYHNLGFYEKTLTELLTLHSMLDKSNLGRYFDVLTLQANCYTNMRLYDEAIAIYLNLKDIAKEDLEKSIINLLNLSNVYSLTDKKELVIQCVEAIMAARRKLNFPTCYTLHVYYELGKIFIYLENNRKATYYLKHAYKLSKTEKNLHYQKELLTFLFDICNARDNLKLAEFIKLQLISLISSDTVDCGWVLIFKLMNFYNRLGKNSDVDQILTAILQSKHS